MEERTDTVGIGAFAVELFLQQQGAEAQSQPVEGQPPQGGSGQRRPMGHKACHCGHGQQDGQAVAAGSRQQGLAAVKTEVRLMRLLRLLHHQGVARPLLSEDFVGERLLPPPLPGNDPAVVAIQGHCKVIARVEDARVVKPRQVLFLQIYAQGPYAIYAQHLLQPVHVSPVGMFVVEAVRVLLRVAHLQGVEKTFQYVLHLAIYFSNVSLSMQHTFTSSRLRRSPSPSDWKSEFFPRGW